MILFSLLRFSHLAWLCTLTNASYPSHWPFFSARSSLNTKKVRLMTKSFSVFKDNNFKVASMDVLRLGVIK